MKTRKPTTEAPTFTVELRPLKDATDPRGVRRLRSLLKVALRRFGLRCVSACPAGPALKAKDCLSLGCGLKPPENSGTSGPAVPENGTSKGGKAT